MFDAPAFELATGGGLGPAAQRSRAVAHPNRNLITPLWHGDCCEGLSSLFAVVNGIRLAFADRHRLTAPELHALMKAALRFTEGRVAAHHLVQGGVRVQLWRALVEGAAEAAQRLTGIRIRAERLHVGELGSQIAVLDALESAVAASRVPLVLFQGGHYTAVSGVTASSLLLFDSAGACWVARRTCGVPRDRAGARHVLFPASFMTLSA